MEYDAKTGVLKIEVREFVEIARRGISSHAPSDDDEPSLYSYKRARELIPYDTHKREFFYTLKLGDIPLTVFAVADGFRDSEIYIVKEYSQGRSNPTKEEISQARGEAFVTAFMLAEEKELSSATLTIVYINKKSGGRVTTKESVDIKNLRRFFEKCASLVEKLAKPEIDRVTLRLPSMKDARFPYGKVREGQHEFISKVYKNLTRGGTLFAMAPTGTGKTVSVLYPAIRALGRGRGRKIFYFTPKTTTANAARECIEAMTRVGVQIKAVMIGAKERICKNGLLCRESKRLCPNCHTENKISQAALALYESGITVVTESELTEYSERFSVCPHELSLTYSELCDIIICDINYLFDPRVFIKRYFLHGGDHFFLIDEAHNLPDRAREMYSAEISTDLVSVPSQTDILSEHSPLRAHSISAAKCLEEILYPYVKDEIRTDKDGVNRAFSHINEPPGQLYELFSELLDAAEHELLSTTRMKDDAREERIRFVKDYCSEIKRINDTLEAFDDGYEMFIFLENGKLSFKLFCIDTSRPIAKRLEKGHGTVFFSATLAPISYYRSVLGGDRSSELLEVSSPFDSSQLSVTVMDKISTRYSEREDTLTAVCRAISACVSAKRGHYMIFSPSFAYSEALAKAFSSKYPKIKVLVQKRDMSKKAKREFLAELERHTDSYVIAFSVTGGIYSEGIDLAGDSLIGAIIVGIAMPSPSFEKEAIAAYYNEKFDEGKQYAYIYPGMNRVFQAAGRVIRREGDKGVVVLIDDRFADPIYKKSIPDLWKDFEFCNDPKALKERLDKFWNEEKTTD